MMIAVPSIDVPPTTRRVLSLGSQGATVRQLQRHLNDRIQSFGIVSLSAVLVDGYFGNETLSAVKYLQCVGGLPVNGRVDAAAWCFMEYGVAGLPILAVGSESTCVAAVQHTLVNAGVSVTVDGAYGEQTTQAMKIYQQQIGVMPSGIVGFDTWQCIVRLRLTSLPCAALLPNLSRR